MKTTAKTLLLAAALVVAAVCAAPTEARRATSSDTRDGAHFYRLGELVPFDGINVERRDGKIVGMSVLQRDGSWLPLQRQSTPTCAVKDCPSGTSPDCWEDKNGTTVCSCVRLPTIIIVAATN